MVIISKTFACMALVHKHQAPPTASTGESSALWSLDREAGQGNTGLFCIAQPAPRPAFTAASTRQGRGVGCGSCARMQYSWGLVGGSTGRLCSALANKHINSKVDNQMGGTEGQLLVLKRVVQRERLCPALGLSLGGGGRGQTQEE